MYHIRKECVICKTSLESSYFDKDTQTYAAHYAVDTSIDVQPIPFNICECPKCGTAQLKYLGDLDEIYKINHADSTGKTMQELHHQTKSMIVRNKHNIQNILEIGSSVGYLADLILNELNINYFIIEPCYKGTQRNNKHIIHNFYEYVDDSAIAANTLIISHVFEHFYNPIEILDKISKNQQIKHLYIVWPDLEYYMQNNILHVLNTEHTYYVDNAFLINLFASYGFELVEKEGYKGHSALFYFQRCYNASVTNNITYKNTVVPLESFYSRIQSTIRAWNTIIEENRDKRIYIWPASIHCLYLLQFGLSTKITGCLDNSSNKINKYLYGYNIPIFNFQEIVENNSENTIILVNGGVFNKDIEETCKKAANIQFVFTV